jgi:hypothetical protein
VKPIVAVVPENIDPHLVRSSIDDKFWLRVRDWQSKGWHIALHGYRHENLTGNRGLVPLHRNSEFAGLSYEQQAARLRAAVQVFRDNGVSAELWVAPFHAFDATTLRALRAETSINVLSDGIAKWPFSEAGFLWIPQQLWTPPARRSPGCWTICLHANDMSRDMFDRLEWSLRTRPDDFVWNMADLRATFGGRRRTVGDRIAHHRLIMRLSLEQGIVYRRMRIGASQLKRTILGKAQ